MLDKTCVFQCHNEMTADMVRAWARVGADEITPVCATVQNAEAMTDRLDVRVPQLQKIADKFYDRWIQSLA